ncbi:MAG: hypothetical protein P4L33_17645, partial [Capsulimonadaceae bacterium]|nr:hypothetical protein [Capsulimonadaceae bacterium]
LENDPDRPNRTERDGKLSSIAATSWGYSVHDSILAEMPIANRMEPGNRLRQAQDSERGRGAETGGERRAWANTCLFVSPFRGEGVPIVG